MGILKKTIGGIRFLATHGQDPQAVTWALKHRQRLRQFENKHSGESCFIIGNGPSLNTMDLSVLKNVTCFGLNKIFLHPDVDKFGIDYHVAVNTLVIEQSFHDFQRLNCVSFLSYKAASQQDATKYPYYYLFSGDGEYFSFNPYDRIAEGCTVTFVALQLAYFMGFSRVYLIGIDHNFHSSGKPNEKQRLEGPDINHFHPDYFGNQEWHLPDLEASELSYHLARFYFHKDKRFIFDATVGGKLTAFPKVNFDDVIRGVSRARQD
jgi:hypothetical protein